MNINKQSKTLRPVMPAHVRGCPSSTMLHTGTHPTSAEVWECDDNGGCGYVEIRF